MKALENIKYKRHAGIKINNKLLSELAVDQSKSTKFELQSDNYDWFIDIELITDIINIGWKISFSPDFFRNLTESQKKSLLHLSTEHKSYDHSEDILNTGISINKHNNGIQFRNVNPLRDGAFNWEGAVVAVVGL